MVASTPFRQHHALSNKTCIKMMLLLMLLSLTSAFQFNSNAASWQEALGFLEPADAFNLWQLKHKKSYHSDEEKQLRLFVWLVNAQLVVRLNNRPGRSLKLGLNGLADLTREEFRAKMLAPKKMVADVSSKVTYFPWRYEHIKPKKAVDWRAAGIMGPVRSQHANNWSCGSCYAFATVGIAEASSALGSGKLVPASEQQIIDCDTKHDHGCDGGDFHNALDYIIYNKGLTSEDNYPYAGQANPCDTGKERDHQVKIDDWESVPPFNETALVQALTMRPVVSAICCGSNIDDWHHYVGGVFDLPCCQDKLELDHAIVLVGYGTTKKGEKFYWLKNSWSEEWGESGYMQIARGVGPKPFVSQCGLASMPTMVFRGPKPPANVEPGTASSVLSSLLQLPRSMIKSWWKAPEQAADV